MRAFGAIEIFATWLLICLVSAFAWPIHGSLVASVVISAISSGTPSDVSATITWTNTPAAEGQVCYGPTTGYGTCTTRDASPTVSDTASISGLTPSTTYHYKINATAVGYLQGFSSDQTFATAAAATCPYGSGGDGCGVSDGLYYFGGVANTTPPNSATFSSYFRQSGQSWANGGGSTGDANHPMNWNVAGIDYGIGAKILKAAATSIDQYPAGTNGCTYYPIGAVLPLNIYNNGWPHDSSHAALVNVLGCTGNGGAPYEITGWDFTDNNPAHTDGYQQCAGIFIADGVNHGYNVGQVYIHNNFFTNSSRCVGDCPGSSTSLTWIPASGPTPGQCSNPGPRTILAFIYLPSLVTTPLKIWNNNVDDKWDDACCQVEFYDHDLLSANYNGGLDAQFNYLYHMMHNPFHVSFSPTPAPTGACTSGQTNSNIGSAYPWPGFDIFVQHNGMDGNGHLVGFGHGDGLMDWGLGATTITDASGLGALTGSTLTVGLNPATTTIPIGATVWDAAGTIAGGVFITGAPSGSGPTWTYPVYSQLGVTFSGQNMKFYVGAACQAHEDYNTMLMPAASANGWTTANQGGNSDVSYTRVQGHVEFWSVSHNTIGTNNVTGAPGTLLAHGNFSFQSVPFGTDATCATITPYSNGNCIIILGIGSLTNGHTCAIDGNGPFPGTSPVNVFIAVGLIKEAYCNGSDQGVWWVGCTGPNGAATPCPLIQFDTAPYTGTQIWNSGNPVLNNQFNYGLVSAMIAEEGHTQVSNALVDNNYVDMTSSFSGTQISFAGGRVFCQSTPVATGNFGLRDGAALNTVANSPSTGC